MFTLNNALLRPKHWKPLNYPSTDKGINMKSWNVDYEYTPSDSKGRETETDTHTQHPSIGSLPESQPTARCGPGQKQQPGTQSRSEPLLLPPSTCSAEKLELGDSDGYDTRSVKCLPLNVHIK